MAEIRASFWRRHRWLMWVGGGLLIALTALAVTVAVLARRAEPYLRAKIVDVLQQHFHARVELDSFHISFGNGLQGRWGVWAEGHGLRIWPSAQQLAQRQLETAGQLESAGSGDTDAPLIRLETFRFHAPLSLDRGKPIVISVVRIEGLDIDVPPRAPKPNEGSSAKPRAGTSHRLQPPPSAKPPVGDSQTAPANEASGSEQPKPGGKGAGVFAGVIVERIECERAQLTLETNKPGKLPLGFAISHLTMTDLTSDGPAGFDADLTNPRPQGNIHTTGFFGPWQASDPGESAVSGNYQFDHADLSDFKGIAGILNSTGHYDGTLRNIVVDGVTDTPDFRLTAVGNAMTLHTKFHAIVDGTDGDTWLEPVDAMLGQSHFTAQGQVVRLRVPSTTAGTKQNQEKQDAPDNQAARKQDAVMENTSPFKGGHDIELNINVDRARIEDFLRLASRGDKPILTGGVVVKATLHIPPVEGPAQKKLRLKGKFTLDQVQFASDKIQGGIKQLSLRGQGRPKDVKTTDPATVDSKMEGDFLMADGVITLPSLIYTVPGAVIEVKGTYGVEGGALDFTGNAKMDATVSQMVGGWKGLLLKPADRFFKKDGAGTEIPIHVNGTREQPHFGIDFDRMKKTSAQRSGENQPATGQPAANQPGTNEPGTNQSGQQQPAAAQPGEKQPDEKQPQQPSAPK